MHGNEAIISVLAWRTLSERERDWLSTCFYVVGLGVAAADGETSREELVLLQGSVAEIARGTRSYVLAQAATRFLQEQRLADQFFTQVPLSPEEGRRRISEAVGGARSVIAKLPEDDRHQFGAALLVAGLAVMNTKGSNSADHMAGARVFDATAEALGIDLEADLAWVEAHRPHGRLRSGVALLAGIAWLISAAFLGYFALQPILASVQEPWVLGNWVIALASTYIGARITLRQFGFEGIADPTPRDAARRVTWNRLLAVFSGIGVPTDILAASVVWGLLSAAWQGYQIAQGQTDPAYVAATVFAVCAVVLSLIARARMRSPKPAPRPEGFG
jgi:hypothetical protein